MKEEEHILLPPDFIDLIVSLCAHCELLAQPSTSTTTTQQQDDDGDKSSPAATPRRIFQLQLRAWQRHCSLKPPTIATATTTRIDAAADIIDDDFPTTTTTTTPSSSLPSWIRRHEDLLRQLLQMALPKYRTWIQEKQHQVVSDLRALESSLVAGVGSSSSSSSTTSASQDGDGDDDDDDDRTTLTKLVWVAWIQDVVSDYRRQLAAEEENLMEWEKLILAHAYSKDDFSKAVKMNDDSQLQRRSSFASFDVPKGRDSMQDSLMLGYLSKVLSAEHEGSDTGDNNATTSTTPFAELSSPNINSISTQVGDYFTTPANTKYPNEKDETTAHIEDNLSKLFPQNGSSSIELAVKNFFASSVQRRRRNQFFVLLGAPATGKTFICQQVMHSVQSLYPSRVVIICPKVPLDFLGRTVGGAEATWVHLWNAIIDTVTNTQTDKDVLVVIDSLDEFDQTTLENNKNNTSGGILSNRLATCWRNFIDKVLAQQRTGSPRRILVIGTCTKLSDLNQSRADAVFDCQNPSDEARKGFLCSVASIVPDSMDSQTRDRFDSAVEASLGRSYGEMAFQARRALSAHEAELLPPHELLDDIIQRFHQQTPPSLWNGGSNGLLDMQVMAALDLDSTTATLEKPGELYGRDMEKAWKSLQSSIIIPLSRSKELQRLLGKMEHRKMVGGVLLASPPGCGKTAIAYEAARYAAHLDPSVKFINVSCTSLVRKEVGGSEKALHQLFVAVRQTTPCILLLESIETIAAVRGHDTTTEGTMDRLLSTLLVELDGIESQSDSSLAPLAVIGTTHDPRWVDPALKRPGRLGAVLHLGFPDASTRRAIIERNFKGCSFFENALEHLLNKTSGMSGATVSGLCNDLKLELELSNNSAPRDMIETALVDKVTSARG